MSGVHKGDMPIKNGRKILQYVCWTLFSYTKLIEYFIMDRKQNCCMKEVLFVCLFTAF